MNILKYSLFESAKIKKFNSILKNLGVMDADGNINLKEMIESINQFLSKDGNKDKFLKKVDNSIKPNVDIKNIKIKAKNLKPSQNTIYLEHILSRLVVNDYDREQILNGKLKDHDILISEDNHIIDGHHRWAAAYILNPKCEMDVTQIQLPIEYALPIINAILNAKDEINIDKTGDYIISIFDMVDWKKKRVLKKINDIITKTIKSGIDLGEDKNKKSEEGWKIDDIFDVKSFYDNIKKKLNKHPLKKIRKNLKTIPKPMNIFGDREDMPRIKEKDAKNIL